MNVSYMKVVDSNIANVNSDERSILYLFNTRYSHLVIAILHIITAVFQFMAPGFINVTTVNQVPIDVLGEIDLFYICAAVEVFTACVHIVYAFYDVSFRYRMMEYAVTATTMTFVISILSGIDNFIVLMSVCVLMLLTMLLGYIHERVWVFGTFNYSKAYRVVMILAWVPYSSAWGVIIVYFYTGLSDVSKHPPPFVYAIIWILFVLYSLFGINQWYWLCGKYCKHNEKMYDAINNLLSVYSKLILAWMLYGGIMNM